METNELLDNEKIIDQSVGGLTLTNRRLIDDTIHDRDRSYRTIPIESVTFCSLARSVNYWFIILGVLGAILAIGGGNFLGSSATSIFVGLLLLGLGIWLFLRSRRTMIRIASSGGLIEVVVRGMSVKDAKNYFNAIERLRKEAIREK